MGFSTASLESINMSFMLKYKGIFIAIILFTIIHYTMIYFYNSIYKSTGHFTHTMFLINIGVRVNIVICALIASLYYKSYNIAIGVISGIMFALVMLLLFAHPLIYVYRL